ncbi:MAG TPA: serine hydrolase domain-containing protein [Polyangiaceae bacterium]
MPERAVVPVAGVKDLSAELEAIRAKGNVPALAAAAFRGDEVLAIGATGVRRQGHDERVTLDDRWHLGSDTKAMTAVLVAMQIERGALHFEDTLGALFGGGVNEKLRAVTIEQLLQHRGGLPHQFPPDIWAEMWSAGDDPSERARAVGELLSREPTQPVGTYEYANTGYVTLGLVLERATKKRWETLIRDDLFGPLGMTSCGFGAPEKDAPWGHEPGNVPHAPGPRADNPPSNAPAGGVHCSLRDWGKFLAVVLAGMRGERGPTMKRLLTPPETDEHRYAGGWVFLKRAWGGEVAMHSGSNTLWTATAWLAPDKDLAFVAASNVYDPRTVDAAFSSTIPVFTAPANRE